MLELNDPLLQAKIALTVCSTIAIWPTIFRLWLRRNRLWWDDAWAGFSLLALFSQMVVVFMQAPNPADMPRVSRVVSYYLSAASFYVIIWSARLAILFSIIRIEPSTARRKRLLAIAGLFFLVAAVLVAQVFWVTVCRPENDWKGQESSQCKLNKQVAIFQLVSDIISDGLLLAAPLKLLQGLQENGLRRRLMIIFSACVVTTIVSLVHATYTLLDDSIKVLVVAAIEECVSLIVSSLPVIVAAIFRLHDQKTNSSTHKGPGPSTALEFATGPHIGKTPSESTVDAIDLRMLGTNSTNTKDYDDNDC